MTPFTKADGAYLGTDHAHPFDVIYTTPNYHGEELALTCSNGKQAIHFDSFKIKTAKPVIHHPKPEPVVVVHDDLTKKQKLAALRKQLCQIDPTSKDCQPKETPEEKKKREDAEKLKKLQEQLAALNGGYMLVLL